MKNIITTTAGILTASLISYAAYSPQQTTGSTVVASSVRMANPTEVEIVPAPITHAATITKILEDTQTAVTRQVEIQPTRKFTVSAPDGYQVTIESPVVDVQQPAQEEVSTAPEQSNVTEVQPTRFSSIIAPGFSITIESPVDKPVVGIQQPKLEIAEPTISTTEITPPAPIVEQVVVLEVTPIKDLPVEPVDDKIIETEDKRAIITMSDYFPIDGYKVVLSNKSGQTVYKIVSKPAKGVNEFWSNGSDYQLFQESYTWNSKAGWCMEIANRINVWGDGAVRTNEQIRSLDSGLCAASYGEIYKSKTASTRFKKNEDLEELRLEAISTTVEKIREELDLGINEGLRLGSHGGNSVIDTPDLVNHIAWTNREPSKVAFSVHVDKIYEEFTPAYGRNVDTNSWGTDNIDRYADVIEVTYTWNDTKFKYWMAADMGVIQQESNGVTTYIDVAPYKIVSATSTGLIALPTPEIQYLTIKK
jgi:hypothetical protein